MNENNNIKSLAIFLLAGVAAMAMFPFASGNDLRLDEPELYITLACAAAIVLVVISDRITSLKLTRDSFEIELDNIQRELSTTIDEVKTVISPQEPRISEIESVMSTIKSSESNDLIQEAKEIGKAMKMLREIIHEYKN